MQLDDIWICHFKIKFLPAMIHQSMIGRLAIVFLVYATIHMIEARPFAENGNKTELDPNELARLNNMFEKSLNLALKDMLEANAMSAIQQAAKFHSEHNSTNAKSPATTNMVRIRPYLIIGDRSTPKPSIGSNANDAKNEDDQAAEKLIKSGNHDKHLHNDARQSGFWPGVRAPFQSGFGSPGYPNLMGGLQQYHPPSLPSFPMFSGSNLHGPRPKTSVIGNNGGPMALTNDNVVVVNVLSSNF